MPKGQDNLDFICRTCNCPHDRLLNIYFDTIFESKVVISEVLKKCWPRLQIAEDDGFPHVICEPCARNLEITFLFLEQWKNSHHKQSFCRYEQGTNEENVRTDTKDDGIKKETTDENPHNIDEPGAAFETRPQNEPLLDDSNIIFEELQEADASNKLECKHCNKTFYTRKGLQLHEKLRHSKFKQKCIQTRM